MEDPSHSLEILLGKRLLSQESFPTRVCVREAGARVSMPGIEVSHNGEHSWCLLESLSYLGITSTFLSPDEGMLEALRVAGQLMKL